MKDTDHNKPGLYHAWMRFALILNRIFTTILFTILYVIVLPFTLMRLADPLKTRLSKQDSYWQDHKPHEPTIERMTRPF